MVNNFLYLHGRPYKPPARCLSAIPTRIRTGTGTGRTEWTNQQRTRTRPTNAWSDGFQYRSRHWSTVNGVSLRKPRPRGLFWSLYYVLGNAIQQQYGQQQHEHEQQQPQRHQQFTDALRTRISGLHTNPLTLCVLTFVIGTSKFRQEPVLSALAAVYFTTTSEEAQTAQDQRSGYDCDGLVGK